MVRPKKILDWRIKPEEYRSMRYQRTYKISNYGNIIDADGNPVETYFDDEEELAAHLSDHYGESWAPVWRHMLYCFYDGDIENVYFEYLDDDKTNLYIDNLIPVWKRPDGLIRKLAGRPTYYNRIFLDKRFREPGRKVLIVETGDIFDSPKDAADAIGGYVNLVYKVLKGSARSHMGFTFQYLD